MDVVKDLEKHMKLVRTEAKNGKVSVWFYALVLDYVIITVNATYYLIDRWDDVDVRINTLKALAFLLLFMTIGTYFVCYWEEFWSMVYMFNKLNFPFPYRVSPKRDFIIRSLETDMRKYNKFWTILPRIYLLPTVLVPLVLAMARVLWFGEDFQKVIMRSSSVPFPLYYPKSIKIYHDLERVLNVLVYTVGYAMHFTFAAIYAIPFAQLCQSSALCAIANVQYELKLLRLSLVEMDECINQLTASGNVNPEKSMRLYQKYFVSHQQDICRRHQIMSQGVEWIIATINLQATICMCASIYMMVQKDVLSKIQEVIFLAIWTSSILLFDVSGERVNIQNEKLRDALYEISWIDKPKWFKSSLLLAMTYSTKPNDIKPFGIFALNLNSFVLTMKAAYTYYNVLHNMKTN